MEKKDTAQTRYDKKNTMHYGLKLNLKYDADIIECLEKAKNTIGIQGYIKKAIREDLFREEEKKRR